MAAAAIPTRARNCRRVQRVCIEYPPLMAERLKRGVSSRGLRVHCPASLTMISHLGFPYPDTSPSVKQNDGKRGGHRHHTIARRQPSDQWPRCASSSAISSPNRGGRTPVSLVKLLLIKM